MFRRTSYASPPPRNSTSLLQSLPLLPSYPVGTEPLEEPSSSNEFMVSYASPPRKPMSSILPRGSVQSRETSSPRSSSSQSAPLPSRASTPSRRFPLRSESTPFLESLMPSESLPPRQSRPSIQPLLSMPSLPADGSGQLRKSLPRLLTQLRSEPNPELNSEPKQKPEPKPPKLESEPKLVLEQDENAADSDSSRSLCDSPTWEARSRQKAKKRDSRLLEKKQAVRPGAKLRKPPPPSSSWADPSETQQYPSSQDFVTFSPTSANSGPDQALKETSAVAATASSFRITRPVVRDGFIGGKEEHEQEKSKAGGLTSAQIRTKHLTFASFGFGFPNGNRQHGDDKTDPQVVGGAKDHVREPSHVAKGSISDAVPPIPSRAEARLVGHKYRTQSIILTPPRPASIGSRRVSTSDLVTLSRPLSFGPAAASQSPSSSASSLLSPGQLSAQSSLLSPTPSPALYLETARKAMQNLESPVAAAPASGLAMALPPSPIAAAAGSGTPAKAVTRALARRSGTFIVEHRVDPVAKMFVECCGCKFYHDMPSRLYGRMAGPDGGAVGCPWCKHEMTVKCCAGYAAVVYLKERLH